MPNPLDNLVLVCPRHKRRLVHTRTPIAGEMLSCPSQGCPVACCVGSSLIDAKAFEAEMGGAIRKADRFLSQRGYCSMPAPPREPASYWEELVDRCDEMLDSGEYAWASESLEGIRTTVSEQEHATERQIEAVDNIARARR